MEASLAYQENDRDIQQECNHGVHQQGNVADVCYVLKSHAGNLSEERDQAVHDGASWGKVVEGDERVHLELGGGEQALNHDQTRSLEYNSSQLVEETNEDKLQLAVGCNHDTNDDKGDVSEGLHADWSNTKDPGRNKHSNRSGGLNVISERAYMEALVLLIP